MKEFELHDDVAIITGGGTGLGLGIAGSFIQAGARVVLAGRRESMLAAATTALGSRASYKVCDVTNAREVNDLVQWVQGRIGDISIVVNNAGNHLKKPAVETTNQELQSVLDTHIHGAFSLTRAALPEMLRRGDGKILFITSMAALMGVPNIIAYSTAKAALLGMVRSLAVEVGSTGVRVNAIAPGWIQTEIVLRALENDPQRKAKVLSRTPMARFGEPSDIGLAAVYLCSSAARFITGAVLPVDGGASIGF